MTSGADTQHLRYGALDGPEFFSEFGWVAADVRSMFHTAGRLKRLPFPLNVLFYLNRNDSYNSRRPWAGLCLLERTDRLKRADLTGRSL